MGKKKKCSERRRIWVGVLYGESGCYVLLKRAHLCIEEQHLHNVGHLIGNACFLRTGDLPYYCSVPKNLEQCLVYSRCSNGWLNGQPLPIITLKGQWREKNLFSEPNSYQRERPGGENTNVTWAHELGVAACPHRARWTDEALERQTAKCRNIVMNPRSELGRWQTREQQKTLRILNLWSGTQGRREKWFQETNVGGWVNCPLSWFSANLCKSWKVGKCTTK